MGAMEGAEGVLVLQWLESRLKAWAGFETIQTGLSSKVYHRWAPKGVTNPFITYEITVAPTDVRFIGATRVTTDTIVLVKAVADAADYTKLAPVAIEIDKCLTTNNLSYVGDSLVYNCLRQSQHMSTSIDNGTQYHELGHIMSIRATG